MLKFSINIEDAAAMASIADLSAALNDKIGLHGSIATAVETKVKDRLRRDYVPRNKRGNFWQRVHDSVETNASESAAEVTLVELGIMLRYEGGDVFPGKNPASSGPNKGKPTKALAVPSDSVPVANGRQLPPGKIGVLAFLRKATGGETVGYLVEGEEKIITRGPNKGKARIVPKAGGSLLYTLRSVTHHKADRNILPPDDEIMEAAISAVSDYMDSLH